MGQAEISPKSGEHPVDNLAKARWQSCFYIWRKGGHPSREERDQRTQSFDVTIGMR